MAPLIKNFGLHALWAQALFLSIILFPLAVHAQPSCEMIRKSIETVIYFDPDSFDYDQFKRQGIMYACGDIPEAVQCESNHKTLCDLCEEYIEECLR